MKLFGAHSTLPQSEGQNAIGMDHTQNDTHQQRQQRFLDLFASTRDRLWRFIRALTRGDRDVVDEIMSETVFRVYQRFEHLRDESAFRAYCFRVARRVAWGMAKKAKQVQLTSPDEMPELSSDHVGPDTATDITLLHTMLAELRPKLRETLVLFEISDLSLEEIREIQGGTLSGVKSRLLRARTQLADLMSEAEQSKAQVLRESSSVKTAPHIESEAISTSLP